VGADSNISAHFCLGWCGFEVASDFIWRGWRESWGERNVRLCAKNGASRHSFTSVGAGDFRPKRRQDDALYGRMPEAKLLLGGLAPIAPTFFLCKYKI
jgi:hypothetical protein